MRENEERYRLLAVRTEELLERERAANHRLRLLQDATAALSAAATPEQVGAIMIAQLRQLLDVESVAAWELRDGVLVGLEMQNWQDGAQERWRRMPLDAGNPVTDAVCRGEQVWFADEGDWGGRYPAQRASLQQHGYTGLACLPLTVGESLPRGGDRHLHRVAHPRSRPSAPPPRRSPTSARRPCSGPGCSPPSAGPGGRPSGSPRSSPSCPGRRARPTSSSSCSGRPG